MRGAFTLVEMLVAVGLVVLMMTLFATIFQMATGAMSTQKGMAENDQRVRLVITRLRNDLNGKKQNQDPNDPNRPYRTFGWVVPWGPDEDINASITIGTKSYSATDRQGYFYISENDPNDDTDDVLALTVEFPGGSADQYFGRAAVVFPDSSGNYGTPAPGTGPGPPNPNSPNAQASYPKAGTGATTTLGASISSALFDHAASPQAGQQYWPNQPEFDDIQGTPNGVGDSQFAEVCYFLRRGTLYRRIMLIRQPNLGTTVVPDGTPTDNTPAALNVASVYGAGTRNFWTDFDYSAYFDAISGLGLRFHGTGSNVSTKSLTTGTDVTFPNWVPPFVLSNPAYRFGFDSSTVLSGGVQVPTAHYGQPREFITTPASATPPSSHFFIGRFTHSETSDLAFGYPGNLVTDPMNLTTALNYYPTTGAVGKAANTTPFAGPRGGEDVLMTNVLKFDIKVFDPAASAGPDGHPGVAGYVHPVTLVVNDDDGDGVADNANEYGWPGSDDGDFRDIGHGGSTGFYSTSPQHVPITMKYAGLTTASTNYTGATAYSNYPNTNYHNPSAGNQATPVSFRNRYDTWNPNLSLTNTRVPAVTGPVQHEPPPFRPFNFGTDGRPGSATAINPNSGIPGDDDGNGVVDNVEEIGWPGTDDRPIPLSAIQIKITFYDRTSKQVRETTLVQSLAYTP